MENYVSTHKKGCITFQKIHLTYKTYESILKDFIAIDTETTGLNSETDKIVEIGAARFHNGKLINNLYNSFVKTNVPISKESSNINKITNQMIQELGFPEHVVYKESLNKTSILLPVKTTLIPDFESLDILIGGVLI